MTTEQKIIKTKMGLLELAKQLDNISKEAMQAYLIRDAY
jgi:hypothetical protein